MQRIVLNLWFDTQAEEAANFYVSLIPNSKIDNITYYTESAVDVTGMPAGTVQTVDFTLDGQEYVAINGGPIFKFTPATSLMIYCSSQQEIDYLWDALCKEGEPSQCGWLTDKYGLSWQIVPREMVRLTTDPDPKKLDRVMSAMFKMTKLNIDELVAAYNQED
ncbi:MAG: VOC family protein [Oscillospiraceae bacterium]